VRIGAHWCASVRTLLFINDLARYRPAVITKAARHRKKTLALSDRYRLKGFLVTYRPETRRRQMNILDRIEARFAETKTACKLYATPASATKVAEREVAQLNEAHGTDIGCEYILVFVPSQQKFTVVFNFSRWLQRYNTGTYLGWFAQRGFFSI
jgi:hypothetical protein